MVPKVSPKTVNGQTRQDLLVDLVNIDTINARNVVVNTGQFTNTEIGTSVGNLILGLGANPDSNSNTIQSGTTSIGVSNVVVASNVVNNLFAGFQAAKSATNVSETVILGPQGIVAQSLSNVQASVQVGANAGTNLGSPPTGTSIRQNAVLGAGAGGFQGSRNVLLGAQAGATLSGNSNVCIGQGAGASFTGNSTFLLTNVSAADYLLQGKFRAVGQDIAQLGVGKEPTGFYALDVSGSTRVVGKLVVEGSPQGTSDICTGQIVAGSNFADTSGNQPALIAVRGGFQTVSGQVGVNYPQGSFPATHQLDVSGTARFTGSVDVGSILNVSGAVVLSNTLRVSNSVLLCNTLQVASNAAFHNNLSVSGVALFASNVSILGTMSVSASPSFASNVNIGGALSVSSGLTVSGNIQGQNSAGFRTIWLDPVCFGNTGGGIALGHSGGSNATNSRGLVLQGNYAGSGGGGFQVFNGSALSQALDNTGATASQNVGGYTAVTTGLHSNQGFIQLGRSQTGNAIFPGVELYGNQGNSGSGLISLWNSTPSNTIVMNGGNGNITATNFTSSSSSSNNIGGVLLSNTAVYVGAGGMQLYPSGDGFHGVKPTLRFDGLNPGIIVQVGTFYTGSYSGGIGGSYSFFRDAESGYDARMFIISNTPTPQVWAWSYQNFSDRRLKHNIVDVDNCLSKINSLRPVQYNWSNDSSINFGFVAQDVKEVIPDIVSKPQTEDEMLGVNYLALIPFLTKSIQELSAKVAALEAKLG